MISSASGYEWINVQPLSGFISGDIMPVRDGRADGSWRAMKYEDLLFLMEAFYERANWRSAPSASVSPFGRAQNRANTLSVGIWPSTSGWVAEYLDPDAVRPSGYVGPTSSAQTIQEACGLAAPAFALRPASTQPKLSADDLRRMFYNVKLATRTITSVTTADIATSLTGVTTYTRSDGTTTTNPQASEWGVLWRHGNATRVGSPYTAVTISYAASIATYPHATAATLLVKAGSTSNTGGLWYDVFAVPCNVSDGVVAVPSLASIAPTVAAAHGLNYTTGPGYITSGGGEVSVNAMALLIDHEFPAEINSLSWDWTPTT